MATRTCTDDSGSVTKNPKSLVWTIAELINDLVASANEQRTDHSTFKALADELILDHATFKTAVDAANVWATEVDADENNICNHLDAIWTDGVIGGNFTFTAGAAVTLAASGYVRYRIGGIEYTAELPATITLEDLGNVTQSNFAAWRIEIDRLGACTMKESPTAAGYASAQAALLAMAGLARTANTACLGYLTLTDSNSVIDIGTDNLNASGVTSVIYYQRHITKRTTGLNVALGAASSLNAGAVTVTCGTINFNVNGLKKTEIAASATRALTDADVISTLKYGAVVLCTDLAGTGVVSLNAAGTPGVTTMAYTSAALARAAADLVIDRLPGMFCPFALISVYNGTVGNFTFKTSFWDAATVTSTIADATVAGWSRTATSGFDSHQITVAAVPADITAPIPAAGPATLTATAPATLAAAAVDDITFRAQGTP